MTPPEYSLHPIDGTSQKKYFMSRRLDENIAESKPGNKFPG